MNQKFLCQLDLIPAAVRNVLKARAQLCCAHGSLLRSRQEYNKIIPADAAKQRARELLDQALEAIAGFDEKAEPLRYLARFVVERACSS